MTDITPNHPAVEAGAERFRAEMMDTKWGDSWASIGERAKRNWRIRAHGVLTAALPHLTADDLPTRLIREIQVRTLRAAARAATYEEDPTGWNYDCDPATVAAFLNELADDIERDDR